MKTTTTARTLTVAEVKSIMDTLNGSGHDIVKPDELIAAGVPADLVKSLTMKFHSNMSDPKHVIFVDGEVVESLTGVHSLSLYESACRMLSLAYESKLGRGSQARVCHTALQKWIDAQAAA